MLEHPKVPINASKGKYIQKFDTSRAEVTLTISAGSLIVGFVHDLYGGSGQ
jgi:hypothetical protein